MATYAMFVLLVAIVAVSVKAYPNHGLDGEFYKELQQLLAEKSAIAAREVENEAEYLPSLPKRKPDVPREVRNWPEIPLKVGQISGVSVNSQGYPVIFHRGPRVWDQWSFNETDYFRQIDQGPIRENTIITLNPDNGKIIHEWGSGMFYMPHGLTMDRHDNYWVTDVALHQAFKFAPGNPEPILTFGVRFHPGQSPRHLCKPTSVAVASTGEIFIADGYCNHRILKFNAAGGLLRIIPNPPEFLSLQVPHGLALMEQWDRICVADRENMRVVCPRAGLYSNMNEPTTALTIQEPDLGRVFAVAAKDYIESEQYQMPYCNHCSLDGTTTFGIAREQYQMPYCNHCSLDGTTTFGIARFRQMYFRGDLIYAVNGPTSRMIPVSGFTIDPRSETIIDHWSPIESLKNPHAIAISPNGSHLYVAEIGPNKLWKFNMVAQNNVIMK